MIKRIAALLLTTVCFSYPFAQTPGNGSVKGSLKDTVLMQTLKEATVSVLHKTDSTVVVEELSAADGTFRIQNLPWGTYLLRVSFQSYVSSFTSFTINDTKTTFDAGTLYLKPDFNNLGNVVVQASPIIVKKDTVEYNASMFKTKPNAVAEDLLKKLPGVQVDQAGNVTAQGETVKRILVDGKRFFGDDPKMATRNLPPDVIDKIQVFDDQSDQSKFTGFDDGNRVKTINITTKKDKRKGYFGKMVAGAGTNENYDLSVNLHRFDGDRQISILGQGNDINKQNFTIQDVLGSQGGSRRGGGNGGGSTTSSPGITTVWAGGGNYRDTWGKTEASGSYFYNSQHVSTQQQSVTKNISNADTTLFNGDRGSSSIQNNRNHRIAFNLETQFDSSNSLVFRPNGSFQTTTPNSTSHSVTTDYKGDTVNQSVSRSNGYNTGYSFNNISLQLRHKFKKKARTLSLDLNGSAAANNGYGNYYAINSKYRQGLIDTLNQYYTDSFHSYSFSPTISYTEPIAKNMILELNYNFAYNYNKNINNTYEYDNTSKGFTRYDSLFSNSYEFASHSNRFTLNYRIQNTKWNASFGSGLQFMSFDNTNTTKHIEVSQKFVNFTPQANFQYNFTRSNSLKIFYNGRTGNPSATQLQPLTTTSDSLNFQIGNPALKPQFTHNVRFMYNNFDPVTQRVIFATINASTTVNDIQNSVVVNNATGGRTSTYVNLGGTYSISGYLNYGFTLKKPKSNLNFVTNFNYSQSQSLLNNASRYTRTTSIGETPSWTTNLKENLDINFNAPFTYYISSSAGNSVRYFTQAFSTELTAYTKSGWLVAFNFDYTYYGGNRGGYNTSVPIFSPSIAKQIFKKKDGEIRLSVFDLFDQNQTVQTNASITQITNSQTNLLTRYVMLTFTYNLNNFAGAKQKRMPGMFGPGPDGDGGGGRRGGGGFRGGGGGGRGF
ncbi:Carboxypeptidase regulatory-like domain-containing protein [Filimonas lacunae]|uniref:Carboxypeptidase regulatory-like domain-containing protein n=1 Tax=Filimonas lacunae TaxID=477680 RepID=A0A173MCR5_9BACT|nr:outer membrane beta-barrel protein [Filimonas lacunae]BAV05310.1 hypothetical protein FLA_1317 [Filimonas lacunae]SIT22050.1 Carboxypeptidase regulatory-like domain-containing protein [Filimonas lacunae]